MYNKRLNFAFLWCPGRHSSLVQARIGGSDRAGSTRWHFTPDLYDYIDDKAYLFRDPKGLMVGDGLDETEVDEYVGTLVSWNGKSHVSSY
ncbi:hypothetical protein F5Y03DRAFT_362551 [Xylaria venustula]|nr:hypothetical protein F5Y03DRAFT_362551 [Xylaria venustula]